MYVHTLLYQKFIGRKYVCKTIEIKEIYQKQPGLHNMLVAFKLKSQFCSGHWLTTTLYSDQVSCTHPWMQEHTVTCVLYLNRKVILLFYFLSKMLSNCLHHRNFFFSLFFGKLGQTLRSSCFELCNFCSDLKLCNFQGISLLDWFDISLLM